VSDGHDARHGHDDGRPHDHDLRYLSHEAQPEVFAAVAGLSFRAPAGRPELENVVRAFLGRLCPALVAAGCVLIGHIKGVVALDDGELEFSLTTLDGEPRFGGCLRTASDHAFLTVNVIVFGVDAQALPGVVAGAWPADGATATWQP
jgi:hypothetical protein